jgi:hypothetical protein
MSDAAIAILVILALITFFALGWIVLILGSLLIMVSCASNAAVTVNGRVYSNINVEALMFYGVTSEKDCQGAGDIAWQFVSERDVDMGFEVAQRRISTLSITQRDKVIMGTLLIASYSDEGRRLWKNPQTAAWDVYQQCNYYRKTRNQPLMNNLLK